MDAVTKTANEGTSFGRMVLIPPVEVEVVEVVTMELHKL